MDFDRRIQLFRLFALSIRKDLISLRENTVLNRFVDILYSEAPCIILTKREPEKFLAGQRAKLKTENVVQLFPRISGADFCHIPFSRFSQDLL